MFGGFGGGNFGFGVAPEEDNSPQHLNVSQIPEVVRILQEKIIKTNPALAETALSQPIMRGILQKHPQIGSQALQQELAARVVAEFTAELGSENISHLLRHTGDVADSANVIVARNFRKSPNIAQIISRYKGISPAFNITAEVDEPHMRVEIKHPTRSGFGESGLMDNPFIDLHEANKQSLI